MSVPLHRRIAWWPVLLPWLLWASFGSAVGAGAIALADADDRPAPELDRVARRLFDDGREAFRAGDFRSALGLYERAYELSARPQLLRDIARAAEADDRRERAIHAYEMYLWEVPCAPDRALVEDHIAQLKAAPPVFIATVWDDDPAVAPPPSQPPAQRAPPPANYRLARPLLVVRAGLQASWRKLSHDGSTQLNRIVNDADDPYFAPSLDAELYFLRPFTRHWIENLGLELGIAYTVYASAELDRRDVPLKAYDLSLGAVVGIPLRHVAPRLHLSYVHQTFDAGSFDATLLPEHAYSAMRYAVELVPRVASRVSPDLTFAWMFVIGAGEADDFSAIVTRAWDLGAGISFHITPRHAVRLGVEARHYVLDYGPDVAHPTVSPDSSRDRYVRADLQFVFSLPSGP